MVSAAPQMEQFFWATAQHLIPNLSEGCNPIFNKSEIKVAVINSLDRMYTWRN